MQSVHQIIVGASRRDAITNMALSLRDLAARGFAAPQAVNKLAQYAVPSALTATGLLSPRLQPSPQKAR